MRRELTACFYIIAATMVLAACKKPFTPKVPDANINVLIVEGVINNGSDSTIVNLSRTVDISSVALGKAELKATVTVEDEQNVIYGLTELGKGKYGAPALALNGTKKYRIRIKTNDGLVYTSAAETPKDALPMDNLAAKVTTDGLAIAVDTHDATNNTRYYRWQYEETWKIEMPNISYVMSNGFKIVPRTQLVNICYGGHNSTNIILASNTRLSQDVITDQAITLVPSNSDKLDKRYSILVKQYALDQAAYEFWTNMKKNTESLGGIFDQQPSAPVGNIRCTTDPSVPVLGYVSVGRVQTKRIFVDKADLPLSWKYISPYDCAVKTYLFYDPIEKTDLVDRDLVPPASFYVPLDSVMAGGTKIGYKGTSVYCADCTTKGITPKPAFWK